MNFEHQASQMNVITVNGRQHVIRVVDRNFKKDLPDPNYRGTGQALVGILKKNETLEQFRADWVERETERK